LADAAGALYWAGGGGVSHGAEAGNEEEKMAARCNAAIAIPLQLVSLQL